MISKSEKNLNSFLYFPVLQRLSFTIEVDTYFHHWQSAQIIAFAICASESEGRVYLVDVYDKSDFSTGMLSLQRMRLE